MQVQIKNSSLDEVLSFMDNDAQTTTLVFNGDLWVLTLTY